MKVERVQPKALLDTAKALQFAQAVRAGHLLFCSGQAGWTPAMKVPEKFEDECRAVFENLKVVLAEAGAGFEHVVEATSFHTRGTDIGAFWRIRNEYFRAPWPAWTLVSDIALALPTLRVEVKVTAVLPE